MNGSRGCTQWLERVSFSVFPSPTVLLVALKHLLFFLATKYSFTKHSFFEVRNWGTFYNFYIPDVIFFTELIYEVLENGMKNVQP